MHILIELLKTSDRKTLKSNQEEKKMHYFQNNHNITDG